MWLKVRGGGGGIVGVAERAPAEASGGFAGGGRFGDGPGGGCFGGGF